jgi:hypothetical protein
MHFSFISIALLTFLGSVGAVESGFLCGKPVDSDSVLEPGFLRGNTIESTSMARKLLNQDQLSYMNFEIKDAKHDDSIVSGYNYNGYVYHLQENNGERSDRWTFVPVPNEEGYFYIYDLRHYKALVAGFNNQDGNMYHMVPNGRDNAKWRAEPVPGKDDYFFFYDKKYGKAICGGDNYDGTLYHAAPGGRAVCQWTLLNPWNTDKPAPMF